MGLWAELVYDTMKDSLDSCCVSGVGGLGRQGTPYTVSRASAISVRAGIFYHRPTHGVMLSMLLADPNKRTNQDSRLTLTIYFIISYNHEQQFIVKLSGNTGICL